MNMLNADITEITKIYYENDYWYVDYKYNVWGDIRPDKRRFKYREDAEKLKVGEVIFV
jgi:hypothetical protein